MNNARSNADGGASKTTDFENQFKEIQRLLNCPESKHIFNNVKGEDIAIFIGNTRSGKSTLINCVIGNQLKAEMMDDFPFTMTIKKANDLEKGPVIGLESVSETTLPSIWSATKSGIRGKVVDAPGFEDNRGEAQDIANTFYIKEIIRNAKSVKFILITDINDIISQNISNFTNFIDKMHMIFPETIILHGGIALVFSKQQRKYTADDMCTFFHKNILDQKQMKVEKSLIKYFADHKECISFFKMPASEGLLNKSDSDQGILDIIDNKIEGIPGSLLSDVKPGISDKSKVFLLQSYADFCNGGEYLDLLQKVKDAFVRKCMDISQANTGAESEMLLGAMVELEAKFLDLCTQVEEELNFTDVIEKLGSLCEICEMKTQLDSSNIVVHIQFVEFLDQMLNMKNGGIYTDKFRGTIEIIKNQFIMARIISETVRNKITLLEAEIRRREAAEHHYEEIKKLVERMTKLHAENEKSAQEQSQQLQLFGKAGKFGSDVFKATGTFLAGVCESAGETLDEAKDWFTSLLPNLR